MSISAASVITELLPALNAATAADLTWWTAANLYDFADEAVKKFARSAQSFLASDTTAEVSTQAEYALAAGAIAVIHVSRAGVALRSASPYELEGLDATWSQTSNTPTKWTQDIGLNQIRLYPKPTASGAVIERVFAQFPADVASGTPTVAMPLPFNGWLYQAVLGAARGMEGEAQMPDIADHAAQRVAFYEKLAIAYYGATR